MNKTYVETINSIIEMNKLFFKMLQNEIDCLNIENLNEMQYFILFNLEKDYALREFKNKKSYFGNITYNLKQLEENGYIIREKTSRRILLKITSKGSKLVKHLESILETHTKSMEKSGIISEDLKNTNLLIHKIGSMWIDDSF